jgi:hypothetical protein
MKLEIRVKSRLRRKNSMNKQRDYGKMLQHDVVSCKKDETIKLYGIVDMARDDKKNENKLLGEKLVQKAINEENKKNEDEIIKGIKNYQNNQSKIDDIVITKENIHEKSKIQVSICNDTLLEIQERAKKNNVNPIHLLCNLIYEKNREVKELENSSFIEYDGREPRIDVLEKLELIINEIPELTMIRVLELKKIIYYVLGKIDSRTFQKYFKVFEHYHKKIFGHTFYGSVISLVGIDIAIKKKITGLNKK